ncbi:hypothetical protein D3C78_1768520 [compost metagenome]
MALTGLSLILNRCCSTKATATETRMLTKAIASIKRTSRPVGVRNSARHAFPATMASTARGMRGNRMADTKPPAVVL